MAGANVTERFTDRVDDYVKYRPGYPQEIIPFFEQEMGLKKNHVVVDVGFGTGLLTTLFLEHQNSVYGVEPNQAMRLAGEKFLKSYPHFKSIDGIAENTTLPTSLADFIVVGQAFHWFDIDKARTEFKRLLKPHRLSNSDELSYPGGYVALIWNDRQSGTTLNDEYEHFLETYGTDYESVRARRPGGDLPAQEFFKGGWMKEKIFQNEQVLNFESFKGRVLSSSYIPKPAHPKFEAMMHALHTLFERHQKNNQIKLTYDTRIFYGQPTKGDLHNGI